LLSGDADSENHRAGIPLSPVRLLTFHYYPHYEDEEHHKAGAEIPGLARERFQENLQLDFVRRSRQQHEAGSVRKNLTIYQATITF